MQIIPYITSFLLLFEWYGRQTEMDIRHLPIDTAFPTGVFKGPLYLWVLSSYHFDTDR